MGAANQSIRLGVGRLPRSGRGVESRQPHVVAPGCFYSDRSPDRTGRVSDNPWYSEQLLASKFPCFHNFTNTSSGYIIVRYVKAGGPWLLAASIGCFFLLLSSVTLPYPYQGLLPGLSVIHKCTSPPFQWPGAIICYSTPLTVHSKNPVSHGKLSLCATVEGVRVSSYPTFALRLMLKNSSLSVKQA